MVSFMAYFSLLSFFFFSFLFSSFIWFDLIGRIFYSDDFFMLTLKIGKCNVILQDFVHALGLLQVELTQRNFHS
ncbi:hypothetical protein TRFO_27889 [Tritrichomonas foetus]|uniref:Uncharacterized protein n=1 Tax=Tritrichomonas foetus TaxID=1144522 RepID=A0A1J4K0T9_9EUKA|nr:hypothetical protein TRFO_27889 [Tritrichomonas foetus]|eukprot:OHT04570.1 hypothetical protein TRFO_27889 [Tritrichomonas foetus]